MNGFFISIEGSDGSGKSTQIRNIVAYLKEKKIDLLLTREPGGTPISEKIRDLLLDPKNMEMTDRTEMLLYAASRAQHLEEKILPALANGKTVLTDRFTESSIAYQGFGRNLGDMVATVNHIATGGMTPHLTIFLDLPPAIGIARKHKEDGHVIDRLEMEKQDFHQRVYDGFTALCQEKPEQIKRIDANRTIEEVFADIRFELDKLFGF